MSAADGNSPPGGARLRGAGEAEAEPPRGQELRPAPGPRREAGCVLVVEDNRDVQRFIEVTLRTRFEVVCAADGQEGLERAEALQPDLIVTDVLMPRLTGEGLLVALRERPALAHIPVLVLSARSDAQLKVRLLREGAQDYLAKPFSPEELLVRASNLVQMKRVRELLQRDLAGHTQSLEALAAEVTARRREAELALEAARLARAEAERASAVKTTFLNLVSHELRTPLTTLTLSLQALTREGEVLPPWQQRLTERMERSVDRLGALIDSVLTFTGASAPQALALAPVDLATLARGVLEELAPAAARKGLALRLEAAAQVVAVTDARLLRLVLVHLLANAVRFTEEGAVALRVLPVAPGEGVVRLEVEDTGPGIPREARARIFEPFEHLEPLARKHTPGLGLGLAVVQQLTACLGGRIELDSREGEGSTFRIALPEVPATVTPSATEVE